MADTFSNRLENREFPVFCYGGSRDSTWSEGFANSDEYVKAVTGSLAKLCQRQEHFYDDNDSDYFNTKRDHRISLKYETGNDQSYSLCSTMRPTSSSISEVTPNAPTPSSDATIFVGKDYYFKDFSQTCSTKPRASYGTNNYVSDNDYIHSKDLEDVNVDNSSELSLYELAQKTYRFPPQIASHQNSYSNRNPPPTFDPMEPMTPGTFCQGFQDDTLTLRNHIIPTLRVNQNSMIIPSINDLPSSFAGLTALSECYRSPLRPTGFQSSSKSPFIKKWVYRRKQISISLDERDPPLDIKSPAYIISELQELGLNPTPYCGGP